MSNGLLKLDNRLIWSTAVMPIFLGLFGVPSLIPSWGQWTDGKQSQSGSRYMCHKFSIIY